MSSMPHYRTNRHYRSYFPASAQLKPLRIHPLIKGSVKCISCRRFLVSTRLWKGEKYRRKLVVKALVAVDYSQPAIWLGLGLIAGGLSLYQLRRVQPILSRDVDIVVSSVVIFSGGILIFQGWRLDPLLLFCQLLTAGTALTWALEAIKLRRVVENEQRFSDRKLSRYPQSKQVQREVTMPYGIPLPAPQQRRFYDKDEDEDYEENSGGEFEDFPMSLEQASSRGYQNSSANPPREGRQYQERDYYDFENAPISSQSEDEYWQQETSTIPLQSNNQRNDTSYGYHEDGTLNDMSDSPVAGWQDRSPSNGQYSGRQDIQEEDEEGKESNWQSSEEFAADTKSDQHNEVDKWRFQSEQWPEEQPWEKGQGTKGFSDESKRSSASSQL